MLEQQQGDQNAYQNEVHAIVPVVQQHVEVCCPKQPSEHHSPKHRSRSASPNTAFGVPVVKSALQFPAEFWWNSTGTGHGPSKARSSLLRVTLEAAARFAISCRKSRRCSACAFWQAQAFTQEHPRRMMSDNLIFWIRKIAPKDASRGSLTPTPADNRPSFPYGNIGASASWRVFPGSGTDLAFSKYCNDSKPL